MRVSGDIYRLVRGVSLEERPLRLTGPPGESERLARNIAGVRVGRGTGDRRLGRPGMVLPRCPFQLGHQHSVRF